MLQKAVENVKAQGAEIAMAPMEIPSKGKFAIYILGGNDQGLWEV